ncbi:amino acid ABC transporter permease [Methylocapsa palsarum]|uniref:General L-amino acid transport system permease protein n=1 Tax=Methylocapsa palsarum TaxID=1612308 RepID=A0A1I3VPQ8_9HYPH|nr:ABC transporter permease subunit [Methylocapsa palsarum]SFJ97140.1 general L-amino acid transport system permease protein [Methylocapsa palsarum]
MWAGRPGPPPGGSERAARSWLFLWRAPAVRAALYQSVLVLLFAVLLGAAVLDVRANMQARGIPTGLGFLDNAAGFDINQTLIAYNARSTYARALLVGLLNTGLVCAVALVFATIIGFTVGLARLSRNLVIAHGALVYVEALRNVPLLLQLLFWYNAVLKPLPPPRESLLLLPGVYLNNRGFFLPEPHFGPDAPWLGVGLGLSLVGAALGWRSFRRARRKPASVDLPVGEVAGGAILCLALVAFALTDEPFNLTAPVLKGFNFNGGIRLSPEFAALVLGLSLYTGAFIAEIVRAGVAAVPHGQSEAAAALGLAQGPAFRLVIAPQAMRVIIPLLTSQYLNLIKNSSLAVFIGYPDLVQVFAGTVLNQTGAAVQVIFITMTVYLAISLLISLAMNLYGRRFALVER